LEWQSSRAFAEGREGAHQAAARRPHGLADPLETEQVCELGWFAIIMPSCEFALVEDGLDNVL
jgi:hypothetical protein